jgi:hypothetical protein
VYNGEQARHAVMGQKFIHYGAGAAGSPPTVALSRAPASRTSSVSSDSHIAHQLSQSSPPAASLKAVHCCLCVLYSQRTQESSLARFWLPSRVGSHRIGAFLGAQDPSSRDGANTSFLRQTHIPFTRTPAASPRPTGATARTMFSPLKSSPALPIRTPSHSPKPSIAVPFKSSVPSLVAFVKTRLFALLALLTVVVYVVSTRRAPLDELAGPPTEYNPSYSLISRLSFSGNRKAGFPRKGLSKGLWKTLDKLQHRRFVIQPTPDRWLRQTSMEEEVYWGKDPLFAHPPNPPTSYTATVDRTPPYGARGGDALSAAIWDISPVHTIPVLPRAPLVPSGAPRTERLMFGTVTTVERAMTMSTLWTRWLVPAAARPSTTTAFPVSLNGEGPDATDDDDYSERAEDSIERPSCLILLADTEKPKEIAALRKLMKQKGLRCKVKTSSYKRYEVRVLSLGKELRNYAAELGNTYDWFVFGDE